MTLNHLCARWINKKDIIGVILKVTLVINCIFLFGMSYLNLPYFSMKVQVPASNYRQTNLFQNLMNNPSVLSHSTGTFHGSESEIITKAEGLEIYEDKETDINGLPEQQVKVQDGPLSRHVRLSTLRGSYSRTQGMIENKEKSYLDMEVIKKNFSMPMILDKLGHQEYIDNKSKVTFNRNLTRSINNNYSRLISQSEFKVGPYNDIMVARQQDRRKKALPQGVKTRTTGDSVRSTTCENCFVHDFNVTINNENICTHGNKDIQLIIVIFTEHKNIEARKALRDTWLNITQKNGGKIRYVFLLGQTTDKLLQKHIQEENEHHHDMIQEDFLDSYSNLTYKSVMGLKWATNYCSNAKFYLKTDDDVFINVPNLMKLLETNEQTLDKTLVGSCLQNLSPNRNPSSKWYVSWDAYEESHLPDFCSGTAYMTSIHLARKLFQISSNVPFFHLEDVYVGLCLRQIGGSVLNVPGFYRHLPLAYTRSCMYKSNATYSVHHNTPSMLYSIWRKKC